MLKRMPEGYFRQFGIIELFLLLFSGPFWPCNDLMGWWFIRCGIWVVFLLALLGNSIVLVISIVGRNKKDVPRLVWTVIPC